MSKFSQRNGKLPLPQQKNIIYPVIPIYACVCVGGGGVRGFKGGERNQCGQYGIIAGELRIIIGGRSVWGRKWVRWYQNNFFFLSMSIALCIVYKSIDEGKYFVSHSLFFPWINPQDQYFQ